MNGWDTHEAGEKAKRLVDADLDADPERPPPPGLAPGDRARMACGRDERLPRDGLGGVTDPGVSLPHPEIRGDSPSCSDMRVHKKSGCVCVCVLLLLLLLMWVVVVVSTATGNWRRDW